MNKINTMDSFLKLLLNLSKSSSKHFAGAGIVLYNSLDSLSHYHCDLVSDKQKLPLLTLGTSHLLSYIEMISNYYHPFHDGFHFINAEGVLTHVAQFLSPPVNKLMKNINGQGARTFCSQSGSQIEGVLLIGSISASRKIYLFEKGSLVNEKIYDEEIYDISL